MESCEIKKKDQGFTLSSDIAVELTIYIC